MDLHHGPRTLYDSRVLTCGPKTPAVVVVVLSVQLKTPNFPTGLVTYQKCYFTPGLVIMKSPYFTSRCRYQSELSISLHVSVNFS